ncbi:phage baseplate assembly protein V [Moorena producens JHB]|uniref:Phage baseplate assembly protein V n=1 Tax=Moorena producens (strain JHB) TaxID=1454205 RepID=A0A1D9FXA6_MOOP1|nr:phage baseplate assembly protein V [Moorena producens]AOY79953.1 phage baseplate assembly protein V [Moorena producens JHB]
MKLFDLLTDTGEREAHASRIYGVVVGVVTNNEDPEGLGRVKVKYPWLSDEDESDWARIATLMAGNERGIYFLPEVDDEVLVAFEHGDVRLPYIIGSLWNGKELPPATNEDGANNIRVIKSRSGHVIRLNDEEGAETIEIVDKTEKNSIIFDTANNTIAITTDGDITLSASQGKIKLEAQNIEIKSSADTKVESGAAMDIQASSTMNLKGQTINLN